MSEQMQPEVRPEEFLTLRKGGSENGFLVDSFRRRSEVVAQQAVNEADLYLSERLEHAIQAMLNRKRRLSKKLSCLRQLVIPRTSLAIRKLTRPARGERAGSESTRTRVLIPVAYRIPV